MTAVPDTNPETVGQSCARCQRRLTAGRSYAFKSASVAANPDPEPGRVIKCLGCALRHWPMLRRSLLAALVVGTALTLLNQGDLLLAGQWNPALGWKIPLTYCVPFLVATYGALTNSRQ